VRQTSRDLLAEILASSSESQLGRDHHFSKIRSIPDFRCSVPVVSYAYHAPYIERLKMGLGFFTVAPCWDDPPHNILFAGEPEVPLCSS